MRRVTLHSKLFRRHFLQRTKDRNASFSTSRSSQSEEPFYGSPRPLKESESPSPLFNLGIALTSATTAFLDPERHEAVASLAEVTSLVALESLQDDMMMHPIGQRILTEQPLVNLDSIHVEKLQALPTNTFGYAYAQFLTDAFNPNDWSSIHNQHVVCLHRYQYTQIPMIILYNIILIWYLQALRPYWWLVVVAIVSLKEKRSRKLWAMRGIFLESVLGWVADGIHLALGIKLSTSCHFHTFSEPSFLQCESSVVWDDLLTLYSLSRGALASSVWRNMRTLTIVMSKGFLFSIKPLASKNLSETK